jgi:serine/threonine-protein kinase
VEARVASQLTHPNTVRVFDYGRHGECAFMVMQLLNGESLMDVIERHGPVEPRRAIAFIRQACAALQEAHSLGLVHRDIKPHNLMLVQRANAVEQVKVLDFGTVKSTDKELAGLKLTADGTVLGTAWYMSPEQARGDELDLRSDLYSLGVILFELLTQRLPFDSPQPANVMLQHVMDPPPLLSDVTPSLGRFPALVGVVSCCLEKDRALRFDDAAAMDRALERASAEVEAVLAQGG